MTELWQ